MPVIKKLKPIVAIHGRQIWENLKDYQRMLLHHSGLSQ